jgi:hypothetical protein
LVLCGLLGCLRDGIIARHCIKSSVHGSYECDAAGRDTMQHPAVQNGYGAEDA